MESLENLKKFAYEIEAGFRDASPVVVITSDVSALNWAVGMIRKNSKIEKSKFEKLQELQKIVEEKYQTYSFLYPYQEYSEILHWVIKVIEEQLRSENKGGVNLG